MITIPTVLILGAGASAPYKFPVGSELLATICTDVANEGKHLCRQLVELAGRQVDELNAFSQALQLSGQQSVDTFLEKRPEFLGVGKEAISCALVPRECDPKTLFRLPDSWYRHLFNKMDVRSLEEFKANKINFITFNYDRSLEHFLFTTLKNSYNQSDEDTAKALQAISIVHVYGQLGKHPCIDREGRPYGKALADKDDLSRCAGEIKLFPEKEVSVDMFSPAHTLLEKAERVAFLGFGYNRTNLERLQLNRMSEAVKSFLGTSLGLFKHEKAAIIETIEELSKRPIDLYNVDILEFLRNRLDL